MQTAIKSMSDKEYSNFINEIHHFYNKEQTTSGWYSYAINFFKTHINKDLGCRGCSENIDAGSTKEKSHFNRHAIDCFLGHKKRGGFQKSSSLHCPPILPQLSKLWHGGRA